MAITVKEIKEATNRVKRTVLGMAPVNAVDLGAYFRAREIPVGNTQAGDTVQR